MIARTLLDFLEAYVPTLACVDILDPDAPSPLNFSPFPVLGSVPILLDRHPRRKEWRARGVLR